MDLDQGITKKTEFNADGTVGSGDGFFFATKSSTFDPIEAEAKGGGLAEDEGGEMFRVRGQGEDGEEISWASFFHEEGKGGGVEGAGVHEAVDGVGEVLPSDVVEMRTDFDDGVAGGRGGASAEKSAQNIRAIG